MTRLDPLADLQPTPPRPAEKKVRLKELADSILRARRRGVSLAAIVKRLANLPENPVSVSPDYLSNVMAEHHGTAWPKGEPRTHRPTKAKGRKKSKGRTTAAARAADTVATDAADKASDLVTTTEPPPGPSPETSPNGKFLKMKDKL